MNALGYLLITAVALSCAILLTRGYRRSKARLLFWSALCFSGLTLTNGMLLVDLVLFPEVDLYIVRQALTLAALGLLVFGFIWDST